MYNFIDPWGKEHDVECETKEGARAYATANFGDQLCDEGGLVSGRTYRDDVILVRYDDETGLERDRVTVPVSFEHYDDSEHRLNGSDLF